MSSSRNIASWLILGPIFNDTQQGSHYPEDNAPPAKHPRAAEIIMDIDKNSDFNPKDLTRSLDEAPKDGTPVIYGSPVFSSRVYQWHSLSFSGINWANASDISDNIHQKLGLGHISSNPEDPQSFIGKHHALVFFLIYIQSPSSRTTTLSVESDDSLRVWLNGDEIDSLRFAGDREVATTSKEASTEIALQAGINILLAAVAETHVEWAFAARIADADGLVFSTDPWVFSADPTGLSYPGTVVNEDPEMPSDLVPTTGRYPTERVQYSVILLDKILRKEPAEQKSLSIEENFESLDVSKPETAKAGFTNPAIGAVLTYNQSWYTLGLALGQLLHGVALSPGETTRIAVIDWNRLQKAGTTEVISEDEALSAQLSRSRAISEVTSAVAGEAQTGFSQAENLGGNYSFGSGSGAAGSYSGFFGVAGASTGNSAGYSKATGFSVTTGVKSIGANMSQNICDSTQQAANSARNRRASIVREVSQKESETLSTRAITNYNHMHALTIQYYEVVQLYRAVVELAKVTRCLFLPMKVLDFSDLNVVRRYAPILGAVALRPEVRASLLGETTLCIGVNGANDDRSSWLSEARDASGLALAKSTPELWLLPPDTQITGWSVSVVGLIQYETGEHIIAQDVKQVIKDITLERSDGKTENAEITVASGKIGLGWSLEGLECTAVFPGTPLSDYRSFSLTLRDDSKKPYAAYELKLQLTYRERPFTFTTGLITKLDGKHVTATKIAFREVQVALDENSAAPHLQAHALYYSQAVWRSMNSAELFAQLEKYTFKTKQLSEVLDFTPLATVGNYVAFAYHSEDDNDWKDFLKNHKDLDLNLDDPTKRVRNEEIVPIPSGGVFAEAVLGRFNSAEKLDISRFWNWQDSPIPITAPEIAPLQAASRAQVENLTPGQLGQPVLNIVNAPAMPDPTGINAVLTAISNGAMFRDMSNATQTMAAATEVLKAGFAAAGHSQDVAAQYAQQAANLKAGSMTAAKAGGGGSSASSDSGASRTTSDLPATPSNLGALVNKGRELDQKTASTAASEWVPYPGTANAESSIPPPPAPMTTTNESAAFYGTTPAKTSSVAKQKAVSAQVRKERVVQFFVLHEDSNIVVPGDYQFDVEEVLSRVAVSFPFTIGSGRKIGSIRLGIPAGTWNISGYVKARLPDNVVRIPVKVLPGLDPITFNAEQTLTVHDTVYEVAELITVKENDAVISLFLRPTIKEIRVEREMELSANATNAIKINAEVKSGVEASGKVGVAEAKASEGTTLGADFSLSGTLGASQKLKLTMVFKVMKELKFDPYKS